MINECLTWTFVSFMFSILPLINTHVTSNTLIFLSATGRITAASISVFHCVDTNISLTLWSILFPLGTTPLLLRWPCIKSINRVIHPAALSYRTFLQSDTIWWDLKNQKKKKTAKYSCQKIQSKIKPCSIMHKSNFKGRRLNNRRKRFPRAAIVFYILWVNPAATSTPLTLHTAPSMPPSSRERFVNSNMLQHFKKIIYTTQERALRAAVSPLFYGFCLQSPEFSIQP